MPNISTIDLNLLVVLHTVLEEQSATRAARRLHVTQSAVSNALARLRELLNDPLFVRHARGLAPTPHALALRPRLAGLVREAQAVLEPPARFDPASSTRVFRLACADYCSVMVLPALCKLLSARAPQASLQLSTLEQLVNGQGLAGEIDLHLGMPRSIPPGCASAALFDDELVCLTRRERKPRQMTLKEYAAATHVRVNILDRNTNPVDTALAQSGVKPRIALTVPHFSVVPQVVANTGYVATLSQRLARVYVRSLPLAIRTLPIAVPPRPLRMVWHQRTDADEGARFLRALVREATA